MCVNKVRKVLSHYKVPENCRTFPLSQCSCSSYGTTMPPGMVCEMYAGNLCER